MEVKIKLWKNAWIDIKWLKDKLKMTRILAKYIQIIKNIWSLQNSISTLVDKEKKAHIRVRPKIPLCLWQYSRDLQPIPSSQLLSAFRENSSSSHNYREKYAWGSFLPLQQDFPRGDDDWRGPEGGELPTHRPDNKRQFPYLKADMIARLGAPKRTDVWEFCALSTTEKWVEYSHKFTSSAYMKNGSKWTVEMFFDISSKICKNWLTLKTQAKDWPVRLPKESLFLGGFGILSTILPSTISLESVS